MLYFDRMTGEIQPEALGAIGEIDEPHAAISALFRFMHTEKPPKDFLTTYLETTETDRKFSLLRAMRDHLIEAGDIDASFDGITQYLLNEGVEQDPIEGWAESQGSVRPDVDWTKAVEVVRNDVLWTGVPVPFRQVAFMQTVATNEELTDPDVPIEETLEWLLPTIQAWRGQFIAAGYWDDWMAAAATAAMRRGEQEAAEKLSDEIGTDDYRGVVAINYIELQFPEPAVDLIMTMTDHNFGAKLLLDAPWADDTAAMEKFAEVVSSDAYPLDQRIAYVMCICSRLLERGDEEAADQYIEKLLELEDQHAKRDSSD